MNRGTFFIDEVDNISYDTYRELDIHTRMHGLELLEYLTNKRDLVLKELERVLGEKSAVVYDNKVVFEAVFKAGKEEGERGVIGWVENDRFEVNQKTCLLGDLPLYLIHKRQWQERYGKRGEK